MLTKRVRSEYMKKFKDPKWDTYNKCYEDLLKYRLSRRLLEQAHNPWFWGDWGSDTESSGKTTPIRQNKVEPLMVNDETQAPAHVTAEPATGAEVENAETAETKLIAQKTEKPAEKGEEENVECNPALKPENNIHITSTPKIKQRSKSKVRPRASKDTDKENRHPFALYGAGEKLTNMAAKKTHNVGPAASTSEIHESALRAKTRREVEKHMKRLDKQRARSADLEKKGSKAVPDFNPWMTEYMRCFSVRSR